MIHAIETESFLERSKRAENGPRVWTGRKNMCVYRITSESAGEAGVIFWDLLDVAMI